MDPVARIDETKPHVVFLPYPAQSHIKCMLKLAKLLHRKGLYITFINTQTNHERLLASGGMLWLEDAPVYWFKTVPDGVGSATDDGVKATEALMKVIQYLQTHFLDSFLDLVAQLEVPATCIICDPFVSFTNPVQAAEKLKIPIILFWTVAACGFMGCYQVKPLMEKEILPLKDESCLTNGYLDMEIDWIPGMEGIRLKDLPEFKNATKHDDRLFSYFLETTRMADKVSHMILHTFDQLEADLMSRAYDSVEEQRIDLDSNDDQIPQTNQAPNKKAKIYQPRSKVWLEFEKFTDEDGVERAKCIHCDKVYKSESKSQGTSNLKKHLTTCGPYMAKISNEQTKIAFQHGDENKIISWRFDQKSIRKALGHMIVLDELPFSFVEGAGFRYFMSICQPSFKVPCRTTITKDIYQMFQEEKTKVCDFIKKNIGRICLTTDTWTSSQQTNYMCLTAHFIDNEWKLRKKVLNFCPQENHRGIDIGKTVEKCLLEQGIDKFFTISVDNASSNDVTIDFLKRVFQNSSKCILNGKWIHIRCVAHILNLIVQDGIKKIEDEVDKVRWMVRWIRQSPSRLVKFNNFAKAVNPNVTKHLIRDVPTRWNSTYHMLDVAQAYEKTFERYDLEELNFRSDLEKSGFSVPTPTDWQNVRDLCHFLKAFYDVTLRIAGTLYVTSNSCTEEVYFIRNLLDTALGSPSLCGIAMAMKSKFDKYFGNILNMNLLLYFALIIDPTKKVEYLNILFENRYGQKLAEEKKKVVVDSLHELYNEYVRIHSPSYSTTESSSSSNLGKCQNLEDMSTRANFRNTLREKMKTHRIESVGELDKFLSEKAEEDSQIFNVLDWWKVNSLRFPILSLMARDLFAIPVSTVASESVFSTSGRVLVTTVVR